MRVAFVNQDRGISPDREKGAAVHLRALRTALAKQGAEVLAFDEPDDEVLATRLGQAWMEGRFDLVYERYSLGRDTACRFAEQLGVPYALEVNSPLLEEASIYRGHEPTVRDVECERFLMTEADRVFAVSTATADYARSRGAKSVEVCPNGVDTEVFHPAAQLGLRRELVPEDRLVIGFHGRLRPWHGLEFLGQALGPAIASGLPVHVLTIGRGDYEEILSPYIPRSHRSHFQWLDHSETARYVACFDVLPLCYQQPVYFSPLKLAEGMACGAVPVVPNGGDWEHFLEHDENALFYPIGSASRMRASIERLVHDGGARRRLGSAAERTAQALSWDSIARRVLSVARLSIVREGTA